MEKENNSVYKEIARWKAEAKLEDTERYFYKSLDIEDLLNGEKCYVIGRKGTGKTAIASYIKKRSGHDHFAVSLTLKNFPFNSLYEYKDNRFPSPNEYITFWKYLIYTKLLYLLCENEKTPAELRDAVIKTIPNDAKEVIAKSVTRTMSRSFSFGFASFRAALGFSKNSEKNDLDWVSRVEALEEIIIKYIDGSKYFVIFDELDEDYRYQSIMQSDRPYLELLTGLFKASQDIKSVFEERGHKVTPVIFLRDDIYSLISDHDKSKWNDLAIELQWTQYTIRSLIAYRISRAFDQNAEYQQFGKVWYKIISREPINYGGERKKSTTAYDWITNQTLLRPRDYIRYLQICSKKAYEANDHIIKPTGITTQSKKYSSAFRQEFIDEMHTVMPDVKKIFSILTKIKKGHLRPSEFINAYEEEDKSNWERKDDSAEYALNLLFLFSVIGNQARGGSSSETNVFRYLNLESELDIDRTIMVHPGLLKSLQIF